MLPRSHEKFRANPTSFGGVFKYHDEINDPGPRAYGTPKQIFLDGKLVFHAPDEPRNVSSQSDLVWWVYELSRRNKRSGPTQPGPRPFGTRKQVCLVRTLI